MQRRNKTVSHKVKKRVAEKSIRRGVFSSGLKIRRSSKRRLLWIIPAVAMVGFLTFVGVRMLTMKARPEYVSTFVMPEAPDLTNIYAVSTGSFAVAIDGEIVTGQGGDNVWPTASTAKMILGLAVMEKKPFSLGESGEVITITDEDYENYLWYINNDGSNTAVEIGEEISEYDALMSAFLASSNNMADTLAKWAFGSMEEYHNYAAKMLEGWGIQSTTLGSDASGYDENWTSTAEDLAIIGSRAVSNPVLAQIVSTSEHEVPVAGTLTNTNGTLGKLGINGVKTGYIGEVSGYNLVSNYDVGNHIITVARLGAESREASFEETLAIIQKMQDLIETKKLVEVGQKVGYLEDWWNGKTDVVSDDEVSMLIMPSAENGISYEMDGARGTMKIQIGSASNELNLHAVDYHDTPSFVERFLHVFGWKKGVEDTKEATQEGEEPQSDSLAESELETLELEVPEEVPALEPITDVADDNCTISFGRLMLINPNFTVGLDSIAGRRNELVSLSENYGILEYHYYNGDNLLDAEAAFHINEMLEAYKEYNPGHEMQTVSCFRSRGTSCGRLCAATGASDHHTGLTCDLIDPDYGDGLDTDTYEDHIEWQWLKANSYKYGFIDRFPEAWAGGPMSEPLNVDENGSTGLFETWHYRYVGIDAATDIATGKYNNGEYDSLEHYLLARGFVQDLKNGVCTR